MKFQIAFVVLLAFISYASTAAVDCTVFCNNVNNTCQGYTGAGYNSLAVCLNFCNTMKATPFAGDDTNTTGNTLGCRAHWAAAIAANSSFATAYCPAVTLTGGSTCGGTPVDVCAIYCIFEGSGCPETYAVSAPVVPFNSTVCGLACTGFSGQGGFAQTGAAYPQDQSGNTAQCRTYHSLVAASQIAGSALRIAHCSHASPSGGAVCGTNARNDFCTNLNLVCNLLLVAQAKPSKFPYSSIAQCQSDTANYSIDAIGEQYGFVNATTGDTLGCRIYHGGYPSLLDPNTHCQHAGWNSPGGVCGTRAITPAPTTPSPASTTTSVPTTSDASALGLASCFLSVILCLAFLF